MKITWNRRMGCSGIRGLTDGNGDNHAALSIRIKINPRLMDRVKPGAGNASGLFVSAVYSAGRVCLAGNNTNKSRGIEHGAGGLFQMLPGRTLSFEKRTIGEFENIRVIGLVDFSTVNRVKVEVLGVAGFTAVVRNDILAYDNFTQFLFISHNCERPQDLLFLLFHFHNQRLETHDTISAPYPHPPVFRLANVHDDQQRWNDNYCYFVRISQGPRRRQQNFTGLYSSDARSRGERW